MSHHIARINVQDFEQKNPQKLMHFMVSVYIWKISLVRVIPGRSLEVISLISVTTIPIKRLDFYYCLPYLRDEFIGGMPYANPTTPNNANRKNDFMLLCIRHIDDVTRANNHYKMRSIYKWSNLMRQVSLRLGLLSLFISSTV